MMHINLHLWGNIARRSNKPHQQGLFDVSIYLLAISIKEPLRLISKRMAGASLSWAVLIQFRLAGTRRIVDMVIGVR